MLGSTHYLYAQTKPTNCLYLIGPDGAVAWVRLTVAPLWASGEAPECTRT